MASSHRLPLSSLSLPVLILLVLSPLHVAGLPPLVEPYAELNGGSFSAKAVPASPDPLMRYVWDLPHVNTSALQVFPLPARAAGAVLNASHFADLDSLVNASDGGATGRIIWGQGKRASKKEGEAESRPKVGRESERRGEE